MLACSFCVIVLVLSAWRRFRRRLLSSYFLYFPALQLRRCLFFVVSLVLSAWRRSWPRRFSWYFSYFPALQLLRRSFFVVILVLSGWCRTDFVAIYVLSCLHVRFRGNSRAFGLAAILAAAFFVVEFRGSRDLEFMRSRGLEVKRSRRQEI